MQHVQWATAKINLFLAVLERRPDGYHNLETVYQSVGLADRLTFEVSEGETVLDCSDGSLPSGPDNLVIRAVGLMRRTFPGRVGGLRITLEKHVPAGGGLGGGSADAAAVLRACNALFALNLSATELGVLGSQVGMDVPFLIEGGRAIGRERGDRLERRASGSDVWAVIAVPPVAISTRWAYEQLDQHRSTRRPSVETFVKQLEQGPFEEWVGLCHNDFETVIYPSHPQVKDLRDRLSRAGCKGAFLSGSGAAVVGLTNDPERAARVAQEVKPWCRLAAAVPFLAGTCSDPQVGARRV